MKNLALIILLAFAVVGCGGNTQRFVPVTPANPTLALDTKTGMLCLSSALDFNDLGARPVQGVQGMPTCHILYDKDH